MSDRFIAVRAPEKCGTGSTDADWWWAVRDTQRGQNLLGYYSKEHAASMAAHCNRSLTAQADHDTVMDVVHGYGTRIRAMWGV